MEDVTVDADVHNVGEQDGMFTAELTVDGAVFATQDVEVAAGETMTFIEPLEESGEYNIAVSDEPVEKVTVEEPDDIVPNSRGTG